MTRPPSQLGKGDDKYESYKDITHKAIIEDITSPLTHSRQVKYWEYQMLLIIFPARALGPISHQLSLIL